MEVSRITKLKNNLWKNNLCIFLNNIYEMLFSFRGIGRAHPPQVPAAQAPPNRPCSQLQELQVSRIDGEWGYCSAIFLPSVPTVIIFTFFFYHNLLQELQVSLLYKEWDYFVLFSCLQSLLFLLHFYRWLTVFTDIYRLPHQVIKLGHLKIKKIDSFD